MSAPLARLSVTNAVCLVRAAARPTVANMSFSRGISRLDLAKQLYHHHPQNRFTNQPLHSRPFTLTRLPFTLTPLIKSSPAPKALSHLQGQAIRGFSRRAWHGEPSPGHFQLQQQLRRYANKNNHYSSNGRRRPFRFLLKWLTISSVIVAIPAVFVFGPPALSILALPLGIVAVVGGALVFTGSLLFIVLPVLAVGGAAFFWTVSLPAAMTFKELDKIIKRDKKDHYSTALSALGPEWEVEAAREDEFFHWTFPKHKYDLDRAHIRLAVLDPNDESGRKQRLIKFFGFVDKKSSSYSSEDKAESRGTLFSNFENRPGEDVIKSKGHFEFRNNGGGFEVEDLEIRRDGDHIEVEFRDDGAKLMKQKWLKKYVALGKVVDKAAAEIEQVQGVQLGEQVVLVRRNTDSFWNRLSIYGDIAPRIPFDRRWIHDVTDE
ncbi:hypothetical protein CPC16_010488 [Podila verticillata]|nr:hypothetical protein BGZ59_007244 [Podila verticillata]KAF9380065.1 hypothetical protein CPC16_010488 [Podila verticillata]KFH71338.1 hypothetical protein MVEG_01638 [Podila verticillata NRRL 6337]